jgi:hypothetical protein
MNFAQAMIVPSLVTMGLGSLMVAQNLSFVEAGYAAPAATGGKQSPAGGTGAPAAPAPAASGDPTAGIVEEFRIGKGDSEVLAATSEQELSVRAVEAAGREDPFLQLVPPDPGAIKVPIEVAPLAKLPPISAVTPSLPVVKPVPPPVVPITPVKPPVGGAASLPSPPPKPFGGDKAPALEQPQWLVRGIVSTGYERICMLEGRAGNNISARIGETLSDGSVIEAISNRGVTFVRGGRRFVKIIGGIL